MRLPVGRGWPSRPAARSGAGPAGALAGSAVVAFAALLATAAPTSAQLRGDPVPASLAARSIVLPGWGQHALGQRRWVAYAAAEAVLWALWADRRGKAAGLRDDYRDVAWRSGRVPGGERRDGDWAYYESLSRWTRSGAFDRDLSAPGLQPEEDPATFNGSTWALAKGLYFRGGAPVPGDPAYEAALGWYRARAYGDGFLWDWTGKERELGRFRSLIRDSDDRFREATALLGAVFANHLLSAADAFVSARVPGSAALRVLGPAWAGPGVSVPGSAPGRLLGLEMTWRPRE